MRMYLTMIAIMATMVSEASAQRVAHTLTGCTMNSNATISINFNGTSQDISVVKNKLDETINGVKVLAKQQQFEKFELQSNNYNINTYNNNGEIDAPQFQYGGNVTFTFSPSDKATDFMAVLAKKGYHANVNVNNYRNGNCINSQPEE